MRFPQISIVTPSFNRADYLESTMCSVLDQGYPNLEYVVIDAGSWDGSVEIIRKYADRLVYWMSEPDRGHADGINKGFAHTTGEIMAWLNSSDVYYPWTLQTVAQVFTDVPEAQWISGVPSHLDEGIVPQNIALAYRNVYDFLSGNYLWLQQESLFWRRSLWDSVGSHLNINLKYACDLELWMRFFHRTQLYNVNTILAGFRYHEDQRGKVAHQRYLAESVECFASFLSSFSLSERWRSLLIKMTNHYFGRIVRPVFQKSGMWGWYKHPRIVRDFQNRRWKVE